MCLLEEQEASRINSYMWMDCKNIERELQKCNLGRLPGQRTIPVWDFRAWFWSFMPLNDVWFASKWLDAKKTLPCSSKNGRISRLSPTKFHFISRFLRLLVGDRIFWMHKGNSTALPLSVYGSKAITLSKTFTPWRIDSLCCGVYNPRSRAKLWRPFCCLPAHRVFYRGTLPVVFAASFFILFRALKPLETLYLHSFTFVIRGALFDE